ncbi:tail fiber domain-containing protein [Limosilactobacillus fermentum]|uniref:tail fiber domain-containing protein n=1 Tax=Limosilactobacillus fermentum TaxID=1613 RepID=UPI002026F89D|nr:tail fiber domain-containing protein [Limosilactobacillus fermentum]URL82907.1 tail fiber domain-containing protein [Limosilactobacillus fermentum]
MPMDNVTLENTQQSISSRDAKSVASVMVNGKWVNLSDTLEQANVKSDVGTVAKQVAAQQEVVSNAASTADSAVAYANDAIEKSRVNSQAIVAQSEAISEAKSAIDSATAEIQQAIANAASDAANIRAGVAQVQNEVDTAEAANSASVEALKSDVSTTKQDLADVHDSLTKAQAAAEDSQKAINKSIAQINSDIEQDRKDIASAQQANADTAKQLDTYSKQAQDQGKTIKSIQDKQDGFTATLADVQGNVTQVSDKVDGLSASLKDAQDNVTSVKAQADQLSATLTDHAKSIATLTASAKELSSTLEDADGRLSKVEQTAQTNSSTLSDVQGDLSQVKQDATTLTSTLKDAQGNISTLQQKADGVSSQLVSAQGDIASLQTDVKGIKATLASHEGDIHTLQADSKTLKDDMQDAQGNISSLQKTATSLDSEISSQDGRLSKVEQTASTLTNEFSDQDGRLSKVEQTASGTQQTVANQQGQINSIQTDVSGIHETITGQGNQITTINATLNGLDTKYEGVSGDLNNLKSQAQWVTVTDTVDLNNIKTPCHEFLKGAVTNAPNETAWWYLTVEGSEGDRITQTVIADQSNNRYTRRLADSWSAWVRDATQTDVTALSNSITTNSTQITQNKQAIDLKADQSTVDKLSGEVSQNTAQLKVQVDQISSKVSSSDFNTLNDKVNGAISSIQKNSTAIDQTNKQISLKADQTEVDQVKQTATQNSSRLDVMDGKISSKVTSTDVNNIVDSKGFATTNTVQSLITQTAGTISESITKLEQTVKQGAENNVQLVRKSDFEDGDKGDWGAQTVVTTDPPAELGQSGMKVLQTNSRDAYEDDVWYSVKPGENFDVDFWCKPSTTCYSQLGLMFDDKDYNILAWTGIGTDQSGQWKHYTGTITAPANASFAKPWFQMGKDGSNTTDTALLAKPSIRRQNATTVAAIQQVTASIDGLQSNVTNLKNDTSSQITQLSNVVQSKVSQGDYNSQINQLKNDINLRVQKGNVISQINQEAGGNTLIQVSNGNGSLILDAANTIVKGKEWIPVAAIADLTADQIQAGTLKGVKVDFRDSTGTGMIADGSTLTFDVSNTPAGYLSYNGMPVAELPDGSGGNELAIRYGLSTAIIPDDNSGAQATFSKAAQKIAYMTGTNQGKQMLSGLEVHSNNHHWLCAVNSDATCNRFEVNNRDGLNIAWHDNTHFFISDGNARLYKDNDDSSTATKLEIHGWAWVNGWVEAAGHSQHSALSTKTDIQPVDDDKMLKMVNDTDLTTFLYKTDVASGETHRHIGLIIDDVHDVAQYQTPQDFIAPNGVSRDDDNMIGALFGAVKALTKRIKILESKVG